MWKGNFHLDTWMYGWIYDCKFQWVDMKQYGFIEPTYYVGYNVFNVKSFFFMNFRSTKQDF